MSSENNLDFWNQMGDLYETSNNSKQTEKDKLKKIIGKITDENLEEMATYIKETYPEFFV